MSMCLVMELDPLSRDPSRKAHPTVRYLLKLSLDRRREVNPRCSHLCRALIPLLTHVSTFEKRFVYFSFVDNSAFLFASGDRQAFVARSLSLERAFIESFSSYKQICS